MNVADCRMSLSPHLGLFCLNCLAAVIVTTVSAQDDFGGGDDAGGADMDMDSMLGPPGQAAKDPMGTGIKPTIRIKTILEESISAMQQLGFIIGQYIFS